ncbi:MAG TPA: Ig-like domain-containing protein [Longimicrobium sp.]|nr:Ig-like domain-containing protein [Longimicrobium sp.]
MLLRNRSALAALSLLFGLAACHDGEPLAPAPAPAEPLQVARLECTVTIASGQMSCAGAVPNAGGARGLVVGSQGTYVFLDAANHRFLSGDNVFSIDVTVQNLMAQALGTTDGTTLDSLGVRVFFYEEPVASDGSGRSVEVINHTGTAFFTSAGQKYFRYDQILGSNHTSDPQPWEFSVDPLLATFRFSVLVSAAVQFPDGYVQVTPSADTLTQGGTIPLSHTVRAAVGDVTADQSVTWGTSDAAVATVNASGLVTAVAPGTAIITATQGSVSGSATIAVCPAMAVGGAYLVANLNATPSFCLAEGEYTVIPVNTSDADTISVGVTGAGITSVVGGPDPVRMPAGGSLFRARPQPDHAFERRLRQMERREFTGRIPGAGGARRDGPRYAITPGVPAVGALMSLNVETDNACSTPDTRTGRVVAVGTHVIVIADTMNPAGGLTAADYAAIADSFDVVIHPLLTGTFGAPSDRDGNGRVIAFYTRAVNELTPPGSGAYVGGFFFSRDLYPAASCPTSNLGEMFYMLAADPAGEVNGNAREADFIKEVTFGTLAHEFEHLINASRRMWVNTPWNGEFEEVWLDEGLAHVSEELMFYQATGLAPMGDLDAADVFDGGQAQHGFFKYGEANFARLRQWLLAPEDNGPFEADDGGLATRGSIWAFLRYAADRRGGSQAATWNALLNTGNTGIANLQAVMGEDPRGWFRDFSAAMYADNAFGAVLPGVDYGQPSWNFRDIYTNLDYDPGPACTCGYELADRNPSNGVTMTRTIIPGGGSSYLRMRVAPSAFAGVTVQSGGSAPPASIRLIVIRRQ